MADQTSRRSTTTSVTVDDEQEHDRGNDEHVILLPGYVCGLFEKNGVERSAAKLERVASELESSWPLDVLENVVVRTVPCRTEEETLGYRCLCRFQIVEDDENGVFRYAMRRGDVPLLLRRTPPFPVANVGLRRVMDALLDFLNNDHDHDRRRRGANDEPSSALSRSLTSATFCSSWDGETDVFVTLLYSAPTVSLPSWEKEAARFLRCAPTATAVIGRSKGDKRVVFADADDDDDRRRRDDDDRELVLRDTIRVSLDEKTTIVVRYRKPIDSFFHPNPVVMARALDWILATMRAIVVAEKEQDDDGPTKEKRKPRLRLLELYCGCGAHTIPVALTGLFERVVAVETDHALVRACRQNWELNRADDDDRGHGRTTVLEVVKSDAGDVARSLSRKRRRAAALRAGDGKPNVQPSSEQASSPSTTTTTRVDDHHHHVLLVDPPKSGLDADVCRAAIEDPETRHVVYVSCGKEALCRDLDRLRETFDVRSCTLTDLFPRTDAVETLVHLVRRRRGNGGER